MSRFSEEQEQRIVERYRRIKENEQMTTHNQTRDKNQMPQPRTDMERDLQKAIVNGTIKNTVYCKTCDKYHNEVNQ